MAAQIEISRSFIPAVSRRWSPHTLLGYLPPWQFWLVVVLGAFLRLWHFERALMLGDQTELLALARAGIVNRAIPVTGIPSSIGTMNPPLSIYVLLPIAIFTKNPLPQVVLLALWNVAGVVFCYVLAARIFGRTAAIWSSLLFAACTPVVAYSRFLWQQNYIAPLLALWLWTLFSGVLGARSRWFVANVALLALATLLHPTALLLAPASLVAWLLAPRRPTWREYLLACGILVLLVVPTAVWEKYSQFSDLGVIHHYAAHPSVVNLDVLQNLYYALGVTNTQPAMDSLYGQLLPAISAIAFLTCALLIAGYIALTAHLVAPCVRQMRDLRADTRGQRVPWFRFPFEVVRVLDRMRGGRNIWRAYVVLWTAVTVPVVYLIRHSSPIYPHYFIVLYPSAFLVFGLSMQWASDLGSAARSRFPSGLGETLPIASSPQKATYEARKIAPLRVVLVALAGLTILGQTVQTVLFITSIEGAQFRANSGYGYPLDEMLRADQLLTHVQQQTHAAQVIVLAPTQDYHHDLTHLLVTEHNDRTSLDDNCLLIPPATRNALYVTVDRSAPASQFLATLSQGQPAVRLAMPGDQPLEFYTLHGAPTPQPGEVAIARRTFDTLQGPALQLESFAVVAPDLLQLRWQVLASTEPSLPHGWYDVHAQAVSPDGTQNQFLGVTRCERTHWMAGDTLFTWVSLQHKPVNAAHLQLGLIAYQGVDDRTFFTSHGLHFVSDQTISGTTERLSAEPGTVRLQQDPLSSQGGYTLPANVP